MKKFNPIDRFEVTLITGKSISLSRHEVTRIFLHPWILLTYSALSLMTVAMNQQPWTLGMPMWLRTAIYFLSSVVGLFVAWATLIALSWAVTLGLVRKVHSIIFDLTGAFMSLFTTYWLVAVNRNRPDLFSAPSAFLYAFYIVIIVHVSIYLWSVVIPRILLQLRAQNDVPSSIPIDLEKEPDRAAQETLTAASPFLIERGNGQHNTVVFGGTRIPASSILHIRAEGNYVRIYTAHSTYFEATTMKGVLSQIPVHLGLHTHRSHWVSYSAIQGIVKDGRGLKVSLMSGVQVPVSRSNLDKVRNLAFSDPSNARVSIAPPRSV
jgi:hypothetical protein